MSPLRYKLVLSVLGYEEDIQRYTETQGQWAPRAKVSRGNAIKFRDKKMLVSN